MKFSNTIKLRTVAAVAVGLLFASAGTKLTYPCIPVDDAAGCVSFEKAIMNPTDLGANKQDSLVRFAKTFAATSIISFALLTTIALAQKKHRNIQVN